MSSNIKSTDSVIPIIVPGIKRPNFLKAPQLDSSKYLDQELVNLSISRFITTDNDTKNKREVGSKHFITNHQQQSLDLFTQESSNHLCKLKSKPIRPIINQEDELINTSMNDSSMQYDEIKVTDSLVYSKMLNLDLELNDQEDSIIVVEELIPTTIQECTAENNKDTLETFEGFLTFNNSPDKRFQSINLQTKNSIGQLEQNLNKGNHNKNITVLKITNEEFENESSVIQFDANQPTSRFGSIYESAPQTKICKEVLSHRAKARRDMLKQKYAIKSNVSTGIQKPKLSKIAQKSISNSKFQSNKMLQKNSQFEIQEMTFQEINCALKNMPKSKSQIKLNNLNNTRQIRNSIDGYSRNTIGCIRSKSTHALKSQIPHIGKPTFQMSRNSNIQPQNYTEIKQKIDCLTLKLKKESDVKSWYKITQFSDFESIDHKMKIREIASQTEIYTNANTPSCRSPNRKSVSPDRKIDANSKNAIISDNRLQNNKSPGTQKRLRKSTKQRNQNVNSIFNLKTKATSPFDNKQNVINIQECEIQIRKPIQLTNIKQKKSKYQTNFKQKRKNRLSVTSKTTQNTGSTSKSKIRKSVKS